MVWFGQRFGAVGHNHVTIVDQGQHRRKRFGRGEYRRSVQRPFAVIRIAFEQIASAISGMQIARHAADLLAHVAGERR